MVEVEAMPPRPTIAEFGSNKLPANLYYVFCVEHV
jgi:hypothetical protein